MNRYLPIAMAPIVLIATTSVLAEGEINTSKSIKTAVGPLGLHGVDAVASISNHDLANGTARQTVVEGNVSYYLASSGSEDRFKRNPHGYLHQYEGLCAFPVVLVKKFDGDPCHADILDYRLCLFENEEFYEKYLQDFVNMLCKAERKWPSIDYVAIEFL